jgi:hypothetical protein
MTKAHHELKAEPAAALATTAEHQRLFPRGALAQERETVAIAALRALGRDDEADVRTRELKKTFPTSPYLAKPSGSRKPNGQAGQ